MNNQQMAIRTVFFVLLSVCGFWQFWNNMTANDVLTRCVAAGSLVAYFASALYAFYCGLVWYQAAMVSDKKPIRGSNDKPPNQSPNNRSVTPIGLAKRHLRAVTTRRPKPAKVLNIRRKT